MLMSFSFLIRLLRICLRFYKLVIVAFHEVVSPISYILKVNEAPNLCHQLEFVICLLYTQKAHFIIALLSKNSNNSNFSLGNPITILLLPILLEYIEYKLKK